MGTWGPGLFSDDIASDIRADYRRLVGEGLTGLEATDALLRDWSAELGDSDVAPVFWLALAATQWSLGRLEERTKRHAIDVIDSGADLRRWEENPSALKRRRGVLAKLRAKLLSPQPAQRHVRALFRDSSEWEVGELIAYTLASGGLALFRVIGFRSDDGGTSPVCELLDWSGSELPPQPALRRLGVRHMLEPHARSQIMIGRIGRRELPVNRVRRVGMKLKPSQSPGGYSVATWKYLDRLLLAWYGLE